MFTKIFVVAVAIGFLVIPASGNTIFKEKEQVEEIINLPNSFDLRDYNGENYVTSVKDQTGGTCWAHGTMSAVEGNLVMTGNFQGTEEPNLAEYHLDWWNGFNRHNNDDDPSGPGLTVHNGGDYLVSSAYFTRGEGAVYSSLANDNSEADDVWYNSPPKRFDYTYDLYYPKDIEWYVAGNDLENIDVIKEKLMTEGVIGTCMCYSGQFIEEGYIHYQPADSTYPPNHAIAIVGWDDDKVTQAPEPGAWLCKNSWGSGWGLNGYFWISYYDKHAGQNPEMGAVSFQDVELLKYDNIYYHDYHGWRDTLDGVHEAFNAFTAENQERIDAVSFYTSVNNEEYEIKIYDDYSNGELLNEIYSKTGFIEYIGYHTIELDETIGFPEGDDFYVYVNLLNGGQPFDRTSEIEVLLGAYTTGVTVYSDSNPGESFYRSEEEWIDFYTYDFADNRHDNTANFCIKVLTNQWIPDGPDLYCNGDIRLSNVKALSIIDTEFMLKNIGKENSELNWEITEWPEWGMWTIKPKSGTNLRPAYGALDVQVKFLIPNQKDSVFTGHIKIENKDNPDDVEIIDVVITTAKAKPMPVIFSSIYERLSSKLPFLFNN